MGKVTARALWPAVVDESWCKLSDVDVGKCGRMDAIVSKRWRQSKGALADRPLSKKVGGTVRRTGWSLEAFPSSLYLISSTKGPSQADVSTFGQS